MKLIKDVGMMYATDKSKNKTRFGIFECSICKVHFKAGIGRVKYTGQDKCHSCSASIRGTRHGNHKDKIYNTWSMMKQRCKNKNNTSYKHYGGRGISYCEEWNSFESFKNWALSNGYEDSLEIDRIDNNGNYEPSNCRFVNRSINTQNTRLLHSDNTSGYRGVHFDKSRNKWKSEIGVNGKAIYIGRYNTKDDAAKAYNDYIISNNLEHPLNKI